MSFNFSVVINGVLMFLRDCSFLGLRTMRLFHILDLIDARSQHTTSAPAKRIGTRAVLNAFDGVM